MNLKLRPNSITFKIVVTNQKMGRHHKAAFTADHCIIFSTSIDLRCGKGFFEMHVL